MLTIRYEYYDIAAENPALLSKLQAIYARYKKTAVIYPRNIRHFASVVDIGLSQICFPDECCTEQVGKRDKYGICPPAPTGGWPDACTANKAVGYWQPWVVDSTDPPSPRRISTTKLVIGGLIAAGVVIVVSCAVKVLCCRTRLGTKQRDTQLYEPING